MQKPSSKATPKTCDLFRCNDMSSCRLSWPCDVRGYPGACRAALSVLMRQTAGRKSLRLPPDTNSDRHLSNWSKAATVRFTSKTRDTDLAVRTDLRQDVQRS